MGSGERSEVGDQRPEVGEEVAGGGSEAGGQRGGSAKSGEPDASSAPSFSLSPRPSAICIPCSVLRIGVHWRIAATSLGSPCMIVRHPKGMEAISPRSRSAPGDTAATYAPIPTESQPSPRSDPVRGRIALAAADPVVASLALRNQRLIAWNPLGSPPDTKVGKPACKTPFHLSPCCPVQGTPD
jgi:hypothetical protein